MRIAILTPLMTNEFAGIANHINNLISYLQQIDINNEYYIIISSSNKNVEIKNQRFIFKKIWFFEKKRNIFRINYLFWQNFIYPFWARKNKIDITHVPTTWFCPPFTKTIITIHDLAEFHTRRYGKVLTYLKRRMVFNSIKKAAAIITVSEYSKKELLKLGAKSVFSIYNGFNLESYNIDSKILTKYNLIKKEYFVFIGTLQHHKNLINMLLAFKQFIIKYPNYKFVVIGKLDNAYKELNELLQRINLNDYIIFTGYVSSQTKINIIKNSSAILYCSLYEGFGFPILEGNALEVPVITSNITAMPEIGGNAAIFVNPLDSKDIYNGMVKAINDFNAVQALISNGKQNMKKYSWLVSAKKTIELYENLQTKFENHKA